MTRTYFSEADIVRAYRPEALQTSFEAMLRVIDQEVWTVFQAMMYQGFSSMLVKLANTARLGLVQKAS